MKFTSFKNWLNEDKEDRLEYACAMLMAEIPNWQEHLSMIHKEDIYDNANNEYGLELEPHITVMYGIHEDEVDMKDIHRQFAKIHPLTVTIKEIGIFKGEKYDVVKYEVPVTKELLEYRKYFEQFPNTQTFDDYRPHITISYIKPGTGAEYIKKVKPFNVTFKVGKYSSPHYKDQYFKLK